MSFTVHTYITVLNKNETNLTELDKQDNGVRHKVSTDCLCTDDHWCADTGDQPCTEQL